MLQRHILSCALALFHPRNVKFVQIFAHAATCRTEFNLLNFMGHVAGANFAQISWFAGEKEPAHTRGCVAAICP